MSNTKKTNNRDNEAAKTEQIETDDLKHEVEASGDSTATAAEQDTAQYSDSDMTQSQQAIDDQGFEQRQPAAATSGGKGMAGTAMVMSLLALGGTGYNWSETKSLKGITAADTQQASVDYSAQISNLEQQIQSLTQAQEKLSAAAVAATTPAASDGQDSDATGSDPAPAETATDAVEAETASEAIAVDLQPGQQVDTANESEASVENQASSSLQQTVDAAATVDSADSNVAAQTSPDGDSTADDVDESAVSSTLDPSSSEESTSEGEVLAEAESAAIAAVEQASQADPAEAEVATEADAGIASAPKGPDINQLTLQQVDQVLADAKKRLGLNEVAQLLSIGEQRLSLAGDVASARAAFSLADQRLEAIDDTVADPVRESIAGNLEKLNALEVVDKNALTQELGNLSQAIDGLAFKPLETLLNEQATPTPEAADEVSANEAEETADTQDEGLSIDGAGKLFKSWGSKIGDTIGEVGSGIAGDLKKMVSIKKTGPMSDIVLAPEQEYFIRENMKLKLGGAQRAVLLGSAGVYRQNLEQTQTILAEFFDPESEDVQSVASRLADMAQINIEPELPDISDSSAFLSGILKQLSSSDSK